MNIEIANRLVELRKKHNLSQEQLAEKLGLSRQAVSKWERAEASPDTSNLILLARLYNISLDELLDTDATSDELKQEVEDEVVNEEVKPEKKDRVKVHLGPLKIDVNEEIGHTSVQIGDLQKGKGLHINVNDDDDEQNVHVYKKEMSKKMKRNLAIKEILTASGALIIGIVYIVLGLTLPKMIGEVSFTWGTSSHWWATGWVFFLLIPVIDGLSETIIYKNANKFPFPIIVTFVYLLLGMGWSLWHPYWAVFLLIPVYYAIVNGIKKIHEFRYDKKGFDVALDADILDVDDDEDDEE